MTNEATTLQGVIGTPCTFTFGPSWARCLQAPEHRIHLGRWTGPEKNHPYQPGPDRRVTADRREPVR